MEAETTVQRIETAKRRLEMLQGLAGSLSPEQRGLIAQTLEELQAVKGELRQQSEKSPVARQGTSAQDTESAQANRLLRALLDTMPIGVIVCDADGALLMTNPAGEAILGGHVYGSVRASQRTYTPYYPDGSPFPVEEMPLVRAVERKEIVRNVETLIRRRDGYERTILAGAAPVLDARGRVVSGVSVFQDITERKRAEEALHENERRLLQAQELLEAVTEGTGVIIAAQDTDFRYTFFNEAYREEMKRLTGKDLQIGTSMVEAFAHLPEQQKVAVEEWSQALRGESTSKTIEFGDLGRHRTVYSVLHTPIQDAEGNVVGAGEVAYDVTAQVLAEQALRESEERYRLVAEYNYDWEYWVAPDGKWIYCSPSCEQTSGYPPERFLENPGFLQDIAHPDDRAIAAQHMTETSRDNRVESLDFRIIHRDGAVRWLNHACQPVLGQDGKWLGRRASNRDITELKQVEEERERLLAENRRQREFLERLVNEAPVGIAVVRGPDHRHEMVNPCYQAIPGVPDVPMVGRTIAEVFPDLPARGAVEFIETVYRTGQMVSIREREAVVGPGREQTYWNVDHVPLHNPDGDVESVLLLASDVTEQVRRRKQIEELATALQSERNILQTIMENTRAHLAYLDPEFNFIAVNSTYVQGCGYSREELIGRNHFALFPHAENQAIFERVRDTGEPVEFHAKPFEYPERPELGTTYWDWTLAPVKGADGQTAGLVLSLMDVTEQIRAQAEIESVARFPRENPNPVLRLTRDGTILYANPGSVPLLASWDTQVGQKAPDEWQRRIAGALDAGAGQVVEAPCDERVFSLTITPLTEQGYANLYALDITELKRAEEALRESEGKLQAVFNILPVGISILDHDRNIVKQNVALERILEMPAQGLANRQYVNRTYIRSDGTPMPPEEFPSVRAYKEQRSVQDVEIGVVKEDGKTVWTTVSAVPVSFSDWQVVVTTVGITDLKQAQQALRRYADLLHVLHEADQAILAAQLSVEEIAEAAIHYMPQLLGCVRASVILLDREADEVSLLAVHTEGETRLGKGWHSPIYAEWAEMIEVLGRGEIYVVEDPEEFASSFVVEALQSEGVRTCTYIPLIVQGQLVGALGLGMHASGPLTSEQKEIASEIAAELAIGMQQARLHAHVQRHADDLEEEVLKRTWALRASEARFRAIFEGAGIGIALVDGKGRVEESNPALQSLLGYGAEELRGMPFTAFSHADEAQSTAEFLKKLLAAKGATDRHRMERRYVRKDGQLRWGNLIASVVRKSEGTPRFAVVMVEDTTEQKRAHEALLQSEKLAVTGRLAASLAHEINNPLQSVIGCLELVEESLAEGKDPVRFLQLATEELERAASIVAQLRDLNRPSQPEEREPTDVNALVGYVLALTKKQCQKRRVEVVWKAAEGLPLLGLVPDRIEQVFLNLVLNATEAMPHGGRLEVRTSRTAEPPGVSISFADSGPGIAADVLPHLFDPFYTTKPDGLGLGLYISHYIVEEHRGHIEVESRVEEGATFTVWLPE